MTTAFQPEAFQNDAFQVIDVTTDSVLERTFVPQMRVRWWALPIFWMVGMATKLMGVVS